MHARTAPPPRPLLRGYLHLLCACLSPFAVVALLVLAQTPRDTVGAFIFGFGLVGLYTASSANHLVPWPAPWQALVARIDHAAIFVFIAATYTPFLLHLSTPWSVSMLAAVWLMAIGGAALRVAWRGIPRWAATACYLALGWIGVIAAREVASLLHPAAVGLCITGGLLFTAGAVVYARRRPDPFPRVFGFHEVFHAFVVAGTVVFYGVIAGLFVTAA